ncbi:hypothetical protein C7444_114114 [Sphaerotilus hippei]|uniref:Tetratricopeptide repeat protein n=2 Tax=Sphaerotilus hippei TaxID=744406 RepID=A0A318GXF3_9BURK|nr:hypothetical protein C7444_114114 [Sphaerotilus hippei]
MDGLADFDDAVLGGGLSAETEAALKEAGQLRGVEPALAMAALMRARSLAPDHPAVLIAFYRHHFYGHRLAAARDIARRALTVGALALDLPTVWRDVPDRPLPEAGSGARTRFYLFVLKGYAYLSLRLDDQNEARDALAKLRELDPEDRVGGALLEAVRVRALVGDDPDAPDAADAPAFGAAAWARASGTGHRPGASA